MQKLSRPNSDPSPPMSPERTAGSAARDLTGWPPVPSPRALGAAAASPAVLALDAADVSVRAAAAWVPEAAVLAPVGEAAVLVAPALVAAVWVPAVPRRAEVDVPAG
jgi:hypothetical protein